MFRRGRGPGGVRREEFQKAALPHLDALYNFALKMTRDERDAEDLVQETYLRAYRFFDRYEPGTNIKAWLFRILKNNSINRYRSRQREGEAVDFGKIEESYESVISEAHRHRERSPEEAMLDTDLVEALDEAIAALPSEYREVSMMAIVEEMSYREIAQALDIPIGTVMSRLHRGRRLLQKRLVEHLSRATPEGGSGPALAPRRSGASKPLRDGSEG